ncbi:hypothetical protein P9112_004286 [Eukaryota sp. TZLM1-RC]
MDWYLDLTNTFKGILLVFLYCSPTLPFHDWMCFDSQLAQLRVSTSRYFSSIQSHTPDITKTESYQKKGHALLSQWRRLRTDCINSVAPNTTIRIKVINATTNAITDLSHLLNVPLSPFMTVYSDPEPYNEVDIDSLKHQLSTAKTNLNQTFANVVNTAEGLEFAEKARLLLADISLAERFISTFHVSSPISQDLDDLADTITNLDSPSRRTSLSSVTTFDEEDGGGQIEIDSTNHSDDDVVIEITEQLSEEDQTEPENVVLSSIDFGCQTFTGRYFDSNVQVEPPSPQPDILDEERKKEKESLSTSSCSSQSILPSMEEPRKSTLKKPSSLMADRVFIHGERMRKRMERTMKKCSFRKI